MLRVSLGPPISFFSLPLRLCALSSGDPSSVVSSFPAGDAPVRGVCLVVRERCTAA